MEELAKNKKEEKLKFEAYGLVKRYNNKELKEKLKKMKRKKKIQISRAITR